MKKKPAAKMHERKIIKINENKATLRIFQRNSKTKANTISINVMIGAKKYNFGKPYCIRISANPFISAAFAVADIR
jgi:ribosomal protein S8E